jgi:hypothetical protein
MPNRISSPIKFALIAFILPGPASALNTTVVGTLGDLDGDGDGGAGETAVVNNAVGCWDARITTNRNFTLTVSGASLTGRGVGSVTALAGGVPTAGMIMMDNDGSVTWFVDPTPLDSLEFTPDPNAQWRFINGTAASGANNADLLRSVAHEIGHANGWICGNAACNRATDTANYDALMNPQPAGFTLNTTVNLQANPGFNVPLRGDGLAGGIGTGGIVNELSHTGPAGPFNSVSDLMFGRTGSGVRETPSMNNVDLFVRAYGDTVNFPPTVDAGADITAECSEAGGSTVSLDGSGSTDPEGNSLTYSWTCATVALSGAGTVMPYGFFQNGQTEQCRLDVTDLAACSPDADLVNVTVVDTTPPGLTVPDDVTTECAAPGGTAVDIGTAVSTDVCDSLVTISNDAPALFPLGETLVTWTAIDDDGNVTEVTQTVTVEDTTPPEISVELDPALLWPPNHTLNTISATIAVTDICDPDPSVILTSVVSSEADNGIGDGNTTDDIQGAAIGTDDREFELRAERDGSNAGRTYTVLYTATDGSGNEASDEDMVTVPHDQR